MFFCVPLAPIKSYELKLSFDPLLLQVNSVAEGNIFDGYSTFFSSGTIDNTAGTIVDVYGLIIGPVTVTGSGTFVTISFTAKDTTGTSNLDLYDVGVTNSTAYISIDVNSGSVSVESYTLTVHTVGSGSVIKDPDQGSYLYDDEVELTAVAEDGWAFLGWSDDLSGDENPEDITITGDMTVTAYFMDNNSPEISYVDMAASNPLDTNPSFGWINISCDVTGSVTINDVVLKIKNPDGSYNHVSMIAGAEDSYYYNSSTAFSNYGNYSYFIWADNINNNIGISSSYTISMPPNWDVDMNGECNIYDLTLLSNHYGETGVAGWIREDIDNNGGIEIFDFVFVSNHFTESWWL